MRGPISGRKPKLYREAGGCCAYCGVHLTMEQATIDHYVPKILGGGDAWANLRLACWPCNQAKGSMPPDEWAKTLPRPMPEHLAKGGPTKAIARERKAELLRRSFGLR